MLMGQITLYISTTWPYVVVMIYNVLTQNISPSDKSAVRRSVEAFALSFSTNFFLYLFNAVSVGKANVSILLCCFHLDLVSRLYIGSTKLSA